MKKRNKLYDQIRKHNEQVAKENRERLKNAYDEHLKKVGEKDA